MFALNLVLYFAVACVVVKLVDLTLSFLSSRYRKFWSYTVRGWTTYHPRSLDCDGLEFRHMAVWSSPERKDFHDVVSRVFPLAFSFDIASTEKLRGYTAISNKIVVPVDHSEICQVGEVVFILSSSKREMLSYVPDGSERFVVTYACVDPKWSLAILFNEVVVEEYLDSLPMPC